jgi:hypothetical protein
MELRIDLSSITLIRDGESVHYGKRDHYPIKVEFSKDETALVHIRDGETVITLKFDRESWAEISTKIGRNPFWNVEPAAEDSTTIATVPQPASAWIPGVPTIAPLPPRLIGWTHP